MPQVGCNFTVVIKWCSIAVTTYSFYEPLPSAIEQIIVGNPTPTQGGNTVNANCSQYVHACIRAHYF